MQAKENWEGQNHLVTSPMQEQCKYGTGSPTYIRLFTFLMVITS